MERLEDGLARVAGEHGFSGVVRVDRGSRTELVLAARYLGEVLLDPARDSGRNNVATATAAPSQAATTGTQ